VHNKSFGSGAYVMEWVARHQSECRSLSTVEDLNVVWMNYEGKGNSVLKGAGVRGNPDHVSYTDALQGTKERVPMTCEANVPGGAWNSRARDMADGEPERFLILTFEYHRRQSDARNFYFPN
jgi:hypothetical protein